MGGCFLAEDTEDHRAIFGPEGSAVELFAGVQDAVDRAGRLIEQVERRRQLSAASYQIVTHGRHTYADRLMDMLRIASEHHPEDRPDRSRTLSRV
jgi:hypothetical protein